MSIPEDGRPSGPEIPPEDRDKLLGDFIAALERFIALAELYPKDWDKIAWACKQYGIEDPEKADHYIQPTALPGNLELLVRQAAQDMAAAWVGLDPQDSLPSGLSDDTRTGLRWARRVMYQLFPHWDFDGVVVELEDGRRLLAFVPGEEWPRGGYRLDPKQIAGFKGALALLKLPATGGNHKAGKLVEPEAEYGPIKLYGYKKNPTICGVPQPTITSGQYAAVRALIEIIKAGKEAGESDPSASLPELIRRSGGSDPQKRFDELQGKNPRVKKPRNRYWDAICKPGTPHGGYRIIRPDLNGDGETSG